MKLFFGAILTIVFLGVVLLTPLAMHGPGHKSNCIMTALIGKNCPFKSFWDYFFLHLNAFKKISGFNIVQIFIYFLPVLGTLFLIKRPAELGFFKYFQQYLNISVAKDKGKFYKWFSLHQKNQNPESL